jgi:hypothetical protein
MKMLYDFTSLFADPTARNINFGNINQSQGLSGSLFPAYDATNASQALGGPLGDSAFPSYGTPEGKVPGGTTSGVGSAFDTFNKMASQKKNWQMASLLGNYLQNLGASKTHGSYLANRGLNQSLMGASVGGNPPAPAPAPPPAQLLPVTETPAVPANVGGQLARTNIGTTIAGTPTGTPDFSQAPGIENSPTSSPIPSPTSGAFPMVNMSPLDLATIGGLSYNPSTGGGGYDTVLNTLKEAAHAGTADTSAKAATVAASAAMAKANTDALEYQLKLGAHPLAMGKLQSEINENNAKTRELANKINMEGIHSPEYAGRVEGLKKAAEQTAIREEKVRFASSPEGQVPIPPEVKKLIPSLAPFVTFGQAGLSGADLGKIGGEVVSRLNAQTMAGATISGETLKAAAIIKGSLTDQFNQATKAVMYYDQAMNDAMRANDPAASARAEGNRKFYTDLAKDTQKQLEGLNKSLLKGADLSGGGPPSLAGRRNPQGAPAQLDLKAVQKNIPGAVELRKGLGNTGYDVKVGDSWYPLNNK